MSRRPQSKALRAPALKATGDLLFEIGCEEIPAGMISKAAVELKEILQKYLVSHGLLTEEQSGGSIDTFGAPRRLVAIVRKIRLRQEDVTREVTGPPKSVAYDNVGEPTRAAMSFAEKQGIPVSEGRIPRSEASRNRKAGRRHSCHIAASSHSRNFMAAFDVLD